MAGEISATIVIKGKLDKSVSSALKSAQSSLQSLNSKMVNSVKTAAKVAGAAAVAATAKVVTDAVKQYSTYEQVLGGVQTLLGTDGAKSVEEYAAAAGKSVKAVQKEYNSLDKAQTTVLANARKAWQTAGVSMNDYMDMTTSMAASLKQSLGAEDAAKYADTAIKDMSDNANKMGTSLSSVQSTYQSLMRGNYAMLDNLKLGYGGTKKELERLVSDASELTGEALDPTKFADIITAIHAVQDNLGITGTTAEEAANTIEGSLNSIQAAWSNWLVGLASGDMDMDSLTEDLITAAGNVVKNVVPRVGQAAVSLFKSLPGLIRGAVEEMGPMARDALQGVFDTLGLDFDAGQIFDGLGDIGQTFTEKIQPAIEQAMPYLQTAGDALAGIFEGLGPVVEQVAPIISGFLATMIPMIASTLSFLAQAIGNIFSMIAPYIAPIIQVITNVATVIYGVFQVALIAVMAVIQSVIGVVTGLASAISGGLQGAFSGVRSIISSVGSAMSGLASGACMLLQGAISTLQGVVGGIASTFSSLWSTITGVASAIADVIGKIGELAASGIGSVVSTVGGVPGFATGGFTNGVAVVGEDPRYPTEAVISFNPAYRAQNVAYWAAAGKMLGVTSTSSTSSTTVNLGGVTFSPNVEVRGNASQADIVSAIRQCEGEFVDFVLDAISRRSDASYSGVAYG